MPSSRISSCRGGACELRLTWPARLRSCASHRQTGWRTAGRRAAPRCHGRCPIQRLVRCNERGRCARYACGAPIHDALEFAYPGEFAPLPSRHKALLVKALITHRARVPEDGRQMIERVFGPAEPKLPHARRASNVFKMLGLGIPQLDETVACLQSRATLWGTGFVAADDARIFTLPLPACLSGHAGLRSLSVTVTWFTPVIISRTTRIPIGPPDGARNRSNRI